MDCTFPVALATLRGTTAFDLPVRRPAYDGKPVGEARGADVGPDGVARFDRSGMISLVARARRGKHVLTLIASDPRLRAFVFTFGP